MPLPSSGARPPCVWEAPWRQVALHVDGGVPGAPRIAPAQLRRPARRGRHRVDCPTLWRAVEGAQAPAKRGQHAELQVGGGGGVMAAPHTTVSIAACRPRKGTASRFLAASSTQVSASAASQRRPSDSARGAPPSLPKGGRLQSLLLWRTPCCSPAPSRARRLFCPAAHAVHGPASHALSGIICSTWPALRSSHCTNRLPSTPPVLKHAASLRRRTYASQLACSGTTVACCSHAPCTIRGPQRMPGSRAAHQSASGTHATAACGGRAGTVGGVSQSAAPGSEAAGANRRA